MKSIQVLVVAILVFVGVSPAKAESIFNGPSAKKIEVPLDSMLTPYHGYDNTNNLEFVLYGNLPNTCYRLDNFTIEKDVANHTIRVRQFAVKKQDGVCGDGSAMPEHFNMLVPFTHVISLGALPAGNYEIKYSSVNKNVSQKTFNVRESHKTTIDDYPYAAVSSVSTSDVVQRNDKLSVTLSGVFTSSCVFLDAESIKVEKQNDVYVVLPVLKLKQGVLCTQVLTPFSHTIEMEAPKEPGKYLVHVRSMNGKSVNKVIAVVD